VCVCVCMCVQDEYDYCNKDRQDAHTEIARFLAMPNPCGVLQYVLQCALQLCGAVRLAEIVLQCVLQKSRASLPCATPAVRCRV